MILYGAPVRAKIKENLIARIKKLGRAPVLAVVQVGDREDSNIYIKNKIKFGEEVGVKVLLKKFDESIEEKDLIKEIEKLNKNENIDGIIVQLPLPKDLNAGKIINNLSPQKDADGLVSRATLDTTMLVTPATARAVMALLDYYEIEVKGKKVVVIGQSILAGKPISDELERRGAEVVRCDSNTKNIPEIAKGCDILVSAVGKAELITKEFVSEKQVVVDVGINRITPLAPLKLRGESEEKNALTKGPKIVGDIDFEEVEPLVAAITPVPGGIGPLTVACLFENLLDLCE